MLFGSFNMFFGATFFYLGRSTVVLINFLKDSNNITHKLDSSTVCQQRPYVWVESIIVGCMYIYSQIECGLHVEPQLIGLSNAFILFIFQVPIL